jgi:hypothetical protein
VLRSEIPSSRQADALNQNQRKWWKFYS